AVAFLLAELQQLTDIVVQAEEKREEDKKTLDVLRRDTDLKETRQADLDERRACSFPLRRVVFADASARLFGFRKQLGSQSLGYRIGNSADPRLAFRASGRFNLNAVHL